MEEIIDEIIDEIYHGFNNPDDLKEKFYDRLSKKLRNEPNKIEFLNQLIVKLESGYGRTCEKENCCNCLELKNAAVKIAKSKIKEMEENNKSTVSIIDNSVNKNGSIDVSINQNSNNGANSSEESWFKKNVKYIYYTSAVISLGYAFYKWLLPLL